VLYEERIGNQVNEAIDIVRSVIAMPKNLCCILRCIRKERLLIHDLVSFCMYKAAQAAILASCPQLYPCTVSIGKCSDTLLATKILKKIKECYERECK
jgi:hypothetical protein